MKSLKTLILTLVTLYALGNLASARKTVPSVGHGFGTTTSSEQSKMPDGTIVIKNTTHEFWIEEQAPAGLLSISVSDCVYSMRFTPEWANIGSAWTCKGTDD